jgi:uncharacterized repeat protein (TIGR03803 family)
MKLRALICTTAMMLFVALGLGGNACAQTFTSLFSFGFAGGNSPQAALVQATNGNLYGTTVEGGTKNHGTVFYITPSGALTTLYSFCSQYDCTDGADPRGAAWSRPPMETSMGQPRTAV